MSQASTFQAESEVSNEVVEVTPAPKLRSNVKAGGLVIASPYAPRTSPRPQPRPSSGGGTCR